MSKSIMEVVVGDLEQKRAYRQVMKRANALPKDYQFVFDKMQKYMWSLSSESGFDMLRTQYNLIELFEMSTAEGIHVLDVTGKDVAAFTEELVQDNNLWMDHQRRKLNGAIYKTDGKND